MSNNQTATRDALDDKANRLFAGKVVRKDLVRKVKVGANVPVFVLEFLLGKYCASSDELAIQMGMQVVNDTLANNYIRPDEAVKAQSKVTADKNGQGRASVDVTRTADGKTSVRQSNGSPSSKTPGPVDALLGGKKP